MARRLLSLCVLVLVPAAGVGQELDKEKLRKAAYLPYLTVGGETVLKIDAEGRKSTPERQIAELHQRIALTPGDANLYLSLAAQYKETKQPELREQAFAKAEELLRPVLQSNDPKRGPLLATYSLYLARRLPERAKEAEQWARQSVQWSPDAASCLTALADRIAEQVFASLAKHEWETNNWDGFVERVKDLGDPASTKRLSPREWEQVKFRLDEARAFHEKALSRAPTESAIWDSYSDYRWYEHYCLHAMQRIQEKATLSEDVNESPEWAELQVRRAKQFPDDLYCQASAAGALISLTKGRLRDQKSVWKTIMGMRAEDRQNYKQFVDRLQRAAQSKDPEIAAMMHRVLFILNVQCRSEPSITIEHGRRALTLDPKLDDVSMMLELELVQHEQLDEAAKVSQARLQVNPTARGCFGSASLQFHIKKPNEAEKLIRRGLELDRDDLHCQLGLAVLMMIRDDQQSLDEASSWFAKVEPRVVSQDETFRVDFAANHAIFQALRGGKLDTVRESVKTLAVKHTDWPLLQQVARAFLPADAAGAIDKQFLRLASCSVLNPPSLICWRIDTGHSHDGVRIDFDKEITALQTQLRNEPEVALILQKMARLRMENGQSGFAGLTSVVAMAYFPLLLAKNPDNLQWQAAQAEALCYIGDFEKADRRALKIASANSTDWRIWHSLSHFALVRSMGLLRLSAGSFDHYALALGNRPANRAKALTKHESQLAQDWLEFGSACGERAIHLAPTEPDAWRSQCIQSIVATSVRNLLGDAPAMGPDPDGSGQHALGALPYLRQLCRICPDSAWYLGNRALMAHASRELNANYQQEMDECLAKLDALTQPNSHEAVGQRLSFAALICCLRQRPEEGLTRARAAFRLQHDNEETWDVAEQLLAANKCCEELKQLVVQRANRFPSASNYLRLGWYQYTEGRFSDAENSFNAGLKLSESDLNCTLGLAAVHLRQSDQGNHLAEAERLLQKAEKILAGQKNADHLTLYGILLGLQGDALLSRLYLNEALQLNPASASATAALQAVRP